MGKTSAKLQMVWWLYGWEYAFWEMEREFSNVFDIFFPQIYIVYWETNKALENLYFWKSKLLLRYISFRWRKNAKKAFGRFWQNDHLQSCASNLSSYFQICRRNLFEINRQAWTFFLPREMMETNFRFC